MKWFWKIRLWIKYGMRRFFAISSFCKVCGRNVIDFHASNEMWIRMVGNQWTIWCFDCFTRRARELKICTIFDVIPHDDKEVDFFLRLHGHLPDRNCGGIAFGRCKYTPDGEPINSANEYVEKLRQDPEYVKREEAVQRAQTEWRSLENRYSRLNNLLDEIFATLEINMGRGMSFDHLAESLNDWRIECDKI